MKLNKLEVKNHRSIKSQWGKNAITFEGLDCLVGKNNVGKTNIISAIKYLLGEEDKPKDQELYWNKETERKVEVRGFFKISEEDLQRIDSDDKREQIENLLLSEEPFDNELGICRITEPEENGVGPTSLKIIQLRPTSDRLSEDTFSEFHEDQWSRTNEEDGFTGTDFREAMREEYPELWDHLENGKETNKGEWEDAYDRYIDSRPDELDLEPAPTNFPRGTKQSTRRSLLPDIVKIPAVKEVEDATQASAELGELTDALYSEIQEDVNVQLHESLGEVYDRLDNDSQSFERRISEYVKEAFRDYSIELEFPRLQSRQLFRDVEIQIDDDQLDDTLSPENVGEGVRRILIFSLLRTIADLREGSLSIADGDEQEETQQPLLILYEEAEVFLHPNLQKTLLRVFRSLCDGQAQIVFNTHSPVLIQHQILDTINIVRNNDGTEVTQFHTVFDEREPREHSRLMDLQKVSSYIFSDQVVLVEGVSDKIVLRKLSLALDEGWGFESQGIPILGVGGKHNLPLFKEFLEELSIDVFVVTDIGALRQTVPDIVENESIIEEIERLKEIADSLVEEGEVEHRWTKSDVRKIVRRDSWNNTFDKLKELEERIVNGEEISEEYLEYLQKLNNKRSKDAWREAITTDHERINSDRSELRENLLEEDILVLNGEIEDYYPEVEKSHKIEAALEFSTDNYEPSELQDHFGELPEQGHDMERFLSQVFESS